MHDTLIIKRINYRYLIFLCAVEAVKRLSG